MWGIARAATKCSWKRGSTAVSTFSIRSATSSISVRATAGEERHHRPDPGGVAGGGDPVQVAIGDHAQDHGVHGVDVAPEGPGQPDLVDPVDAVVVHEEAGPGMERGLGQLDRPDVVLGDLDPRASQQST